MDVPICFLVKDTAHLIVDELDMAGVWRLRRVNRYLKKIIDNHLIYQETQKFSYQIGSGLRLSRLNSWWNNCLERRTSRKTLQAALRLLSPEERIAEQSYIFADACSNNHLEFAQTCIPADQSEEEKMSICTRVCYLGHQEIAEWLYYLYEGFNWKSCLIPAIRNGNITIVAWVLSITGMSLTSKHLMKICSCGHEKLFHWALQQYPAIKPTRPDENLFDHAADGACKSILVTLQTWFPGTDLKNLYTLCTALRKHRPDTVDWALSDGLDPNGINEMFIRDLGVNYEEKIFQELHRIGYTMSKYRLDIIPYYDIRDKVRAIWAT